MAPAKTVATRASTTIITIARERAPAVPRPQACRGPIMQHTSFRALPWQRRVCVCRACNLDADGSHRRVHGAAHNFVHVTLHALPLSVLEAPLGCLWGPLHRLPARRGQRLLSSRGPLLSAARVFLSVEWGNRVAHLQRGGRRLLLAGRRRPLAATLCVDVPTPEKHTAMLSACPASPPARAR
eukprot:COSAG01_NODE_1099_length_11701_cov_8.251508_2_plen_183_part_00